jgi:hypothetical protein
VIDNNELELLESSNDPFEVLSKHLREGTEKTHEKPQSG